MEAAIDDGQRQTIAVPEQEHYRHTKELVHFTGDARKLRTRILIACQINSKEQVGLNNHVIHLPATESELSLHDLGDFIAGELKEQIDRAPVIEKRGFLVQLLLRVECLTK